MNRIKGGSTKIGLKTKDIEKWIKEDETAKRFARTLSTQQPQHTVVVRDFYLMVNELTNEQYSAFVRAAGHRPPLHWGEEALNAAQNLFLQEEGRKREEAKKAGGEVPERVAFDRPVWWSKNWQGAEWQIPKGQEHMPVVYVDFQDAEAYCRWSGLRLPTEEEYQRAVRASTERPFPWGDEWDNRKFAATSAFGKNSAFRVGSFPEGVSEDGIHDLSGNVWEWTTSPFRAYPKWKMLDFKIGRGNNKETVQGMVGWDPNDRVAVSGSFQNVALAARCTTRRQTERFQTTSALGFRCAASPKIGLDVATKVFKRDISPEARPKGPDGPITFDAELTVAMDRWKTSAPTSSSQGIVEPGAPAKKSQGKGKENDSQAYAPPTGYAVIESYEYALFTPVEQLYGATQADIQKQSVDQGPVYVGYFSTNQTLTGPALEPGTYLVAFRGAGEPRDRRQQKAEGEAEDGDSQEAEAGDEDLSGTALLAQLVEEVDLDPKRSNLIFYDGHGKAILAVPFDRGDELEYSRAKSSVISKFDKTIYFMTTDEEGEEVEESREEEWMRFRLCIPARSPRKGYFFNVDFKFDAEAMGSGWRLSKPK